MSAKQIAIPAKFKKYFWDVDTSTFRAENAAYIVERMLEYGNSEALAWLNNKFPADFIRNIIKKSRRLSKKSVNFYSLYYSIKSEEILCLQKDYQDKHRRIWRY